MESEHLAAVWQDIRQYLEARKAEVYTEMRQYPPPIPACDVQFNTLLQKRTEISLELGRMDRLSHQPLSAATIDSFVDASLHMEDEAKALFKARLNLSLPVEA